MRLILMRHAKSDWSILGDDFDRVLNGRGRDSARALGDWLRSSGYEPDEVLSSNSARTRETALLVGFDVPTRFARELYHASSDRMMSVLRSATEPCVLLIGHNPGIAELAGRLVRRAPRHARFDDYPTCATLIADFEADSWDEVNFGTGEVQDFLVPRELLEA